MASDYGITLLKKELSNIGDRKKRSLINKVINRLPKETSLKTMLDLIDSETKIKLILVGEGNELYGQMGLCKKNNACYETHEFNRCNAKQCPFYRND